MRASVINFLPTWLHQTQTLVYSQVAALQAIGVDTHVVCERTQVCHDAQFLHECAMRVHVICLFGGGIISRI